MEKTEKVNKKIKESEIVNGWVERIGEALDYWCNSVSGDDPLTCYSAHADLSALDLAYEFSGNNYPWLSESEIRALEKLPDRIIEKISVKLSRAIERVVNELYKEYKDECGEDLF